MKLNNIEEVKVILEMTASQRNEMQSILATTIDYFMATQNPSNQSFINNLDWIYSMLPQLKNN